MENILITGENGFVGNQFQLFLSGDKYKVERISLRNNSWKFRSFKKYDVVIHLAALVHNNQPDAKIIDYMNTNYHLTRKLAKKAKDDGVSQFIFFSTMSVFGLTGSINEKCEINQLTPYKPNSAYGYSKLLAERELQKLSNDKFVVNIVRPPMIYGKGGPGNFAKLIKVANLSKIFPKYNNERSVIHIENLYKHILNLMINKESDITHPQNMEYMNTNTALLLIRHHLRKSSKLIEVPLPSIASKILGKINIANKIYGNLTYAKNMDDRETKELHFDTFDQTIRKTLK
ncbi:NAD-dependent epimerase/dehydratase family protein [Staphylococcus xylosus]|uniref:NAD-dependent epimerase/dehydratase family protein n=1 Tax=Staphylococcus xylosus TaxID=1288 RepID=UPI002DBB7E4F|nr:NAD-dependent epimerase/dehydratase family protein [Staphylococcus xylosus]MEB7755034.1 NAD-dependent epimerase/dehydratase family protein [Staphylococcus xylosus]